MDIHQEVTDKIVEMLEQGAGSFTMPWAYHGDTPFNPISGNHYNGINILLLWVAQAERGYSHHHYASFKQWQSRGGKVRKGEKGNAIIFYKQRKIEKEVDGETEEYTVPLIRKYYVFNIDQLEVVPEQYSIPERPEVKFEQDTVDDFVYHTGADIHVGGGKAYYMPSRDEIHMPSMNLFTGTETSSAEECYYSTLLHELTHWTGHVARCDRLGDKSKKGYAFEELVAEIGSAFLCSHLGVTPEPRLDHAQYLENWLQALKNDKRLIFKASAQADKAVKYLFNLVEVKTEEVA